MGYVCSAHQPTGDSVHHDSLGEVHGVGHSQNHESGVVSRGPVKQVVEYRLLPRPQQVQLHSREGSERRY